VFDLESQKWIINRVYLNGERIDDKTYPYDEIMDNVLGHRQMHTATTVIESEFY